MKLSSAARNCPIPSKGIFQGLIEPFGFALTRRSIIRRIEPSLRFAIFRLQCSEGFVGAGKRALRTGKTLIGQREIGISKVAGERSL